MNNVAEILNLIDRFPTGLGQISKSPNSERILNIFYQISLHKTDDIRKALVKYCSKNRDNMLDLLNIYMLNRFLFSVDPFVDDNVVGFGAFAGTPRKDNKTDNLWPLCINKQNEISICSEIAGYYGPPYRAFEEFAYFSKIYQRRKLRQSIQVEPEKT